MAYHKWDIKYYERELEKANQYNQRLTLQVCDLQNQLSKMNGKLDFIKPVLFLEAGCTLEPIIQVELSLQFHIVWLKRGASAPIIYEPKQPS